MKIILFIFEPGISDIFGFDSIEEAKKSSPIDHYMPESYADYLARAEKLSRGEVVSNKIEVDIVRKDGSIRHVQVFGTSVSEMENGRGKLSTTILLPLNRPKQS